MATWKETLDCLKDCVNRFDPLTLERFACILDCYEEKAKQIVNVSTFPEGTPVSVQNVTIPPNGKDTMEVLLLLLDLLPPEQFICTENINDIEELEFNGKTIDLTTPC